MRSRALLLAAAASMALAACAGGTTPDPTAASPTSSSGSGSPDSEGTRCASFDQDCVDELPPDTVELRGVLFQPDELTVSAGTTVTFTNIDPVDHTVTAGTPGTPEPEAFDMTLETAGDQTEITFDEPGEVAYFCRIHPGTMAGVIVVE